MGGYKSWPDRWPGPEPIRHVPGSGYSVQAELDGKLIPPANSANWDFSLAKHFLHRAI
jgi:hypothetical protein